MQQHSRSQLVSAPVPAWLVVVVVLTFAAAVEARALAQQQQQCPQGCGTTACVQVGTSGGYRCTSCQGSLMVMSDGTCGCVAGWYYSGLTTCSACTKGSYCPGGSLTTDTQPKEWPCPDGMTTLGARASNVLQCVNLPGRYYVPGNGTDVAPSALPCPVDSWSRGMRKQRQCVPCPFGYTTGNMTGASAVDYCYVAAGYYLPPGATAAAKCPRGTYKAATGSSDCLACVLGVTTAAEGSTSAADCAVLQPGMYATSINGSSITAARRCPQRFYCPGGVPLGPVNPGALAALNPADPTIKACPSGTWTQGLKAASAEECFTPPGYFTANGTTSQCPPGSYRPDWAPPETAATCSSCGEGVSSGPTDTLAVFDAASEAESMLQVATDASGCYIKPGQGLYSIMLNGVRVSRATNCNSNSYGATQVTYGLAPSPCRQCPAGLVTSADRSNYPNSATFYVEDSSGAGGFTDPRACVTPPGWGFDSRQASPCPPGFYNNQDTLSTCNRCPQGTTTAGPGAGVTAADCKLAPGFGTYAGVTLSCPVGTYRDTAANVTADSPCTQCPTGTSTVAQGSTSAADCQVCKGGFGGPGCSTPCGGGAAAAATFGVAGRPVGTSCTACAAAQTGYTYVGAGFVDSFAPRPVARLGADSPADCLSEFVQVEDAAWYLPYAGSLVTTAGVASFAACAATCQDECQFVTYDYSSRACSIKKHADPVNMGAPYVAFKTENSGDAAASSVKKARATKPAAASASRVATKALSAGSYVFYQDVNAYDVGVQYAAPGAADFASVDDCFMACDFDNACAGVVLDPTSSTTVVPKTCRIIKGDGRPNTLKRSMVRADVTRLSPPESLTTMTHQG